MKTHLAIKSITLFLSWLTLSLLLLILDCRWKLLPKWLRIVLFVLSPMMLILYLIIVGWALEGHENYLRKYYYVRPRVVESLIGVRMPAYKVVDCNLGYGENVTMHIDTFYLEFKDMPDGTFYKDLQNKDFDYQNGCYRIHLFCDSNWRHNYFFFQHGNS